MTGWATILAAARAECETFERACGAPRAAQLALLRRIVADNSASVFGRAHGFDRIDSVAAFRAQVPIRDYDALRPWIDRAAVGEAAILTAAPIVAFEETGGTTSGRKLIPYSQAGLAAFRAAVLPWLDDLARQRPSTLEGSAYVSLSPVARVPRVTAGGIPIGLPSEYGYLGADLAAALASVLAVPAAVGLVRDLEHWRLLTLRWLVQAADLSFISVWSPTFLTGLIEALPGLAEPLARAVYEGALGCELPSLATSTFIGTFSADPERARVVEAALAQRPVDTRRLWPRLATISSWADGTSRLYAQHLREMFPHARLQPKGLLATEGAVTIPQFRAGGAVPALGSAFIEFIDNAGRPCLCDELREGADYRVVITTPGGLYRYDLGDRLRCHGYSGGLPRLEFIGRAGVASDIVGEKLSEDIVSAALGDLGDGACLVARATATPFYELLIDAPSGEDLARHARLIEGRLRANPQYAYARALGQLGPVAPRAVAGLLDRYTRAQARRGCRLGDIKPPVLIGDAAAYDALIGANEA